MATLPLADGTAGSLNGASTTNAQQKTNFVNLRTFLSDLLGTDSSNKLAARVALGVTAAVQNQSDIAFTTAGTSTAYTLTPTTAIAAYAANQRFNVTFHTSSGDSPTIAISGLAAKSLMQYDSTGTKIAAIVYADQIVDIVYDGTDFVVLDPAPSATGSNKQIQPISASVASNALTVSLSPTTLEFRSATLSSGTVNSRVIGSTLSLTVPSTATLGTISGQPARLAILALDNAGTVELAICNLSGTSLDETTLISTTAISTGSTSNSVIYSASARTSVPFRIVGFIDSTQATAGTWATAPSVIQGAGGDALKTIGRFQGFASVSPTGSTTISFTGIPSWARRITLVANGINGSATQNLLVGNGANITSGYNYVLSILGASTVTTTSATSAAAFTGYTGTAVGTKITFIRSADKSVWHMQMVQHTGTPSQILMYGYVTVSGALDRVVWTTNNAFTTGTFSLMYE